MEDTSIIKTGKIAIEHQYIFAMSITLTPIDVACVIMTAVVLFSMGYYIGKAHGTESVENKFIDRFMS